MNDRVRSTVFGTSEKISGVGVGERVSEVGEKLKGSVNVSISFVDPQINNSKKIEERLDKLEKNE
jgi:hypothetical protein